MCVNERQSDGWPYSAAQFCSCEQGGLSVLTKGNPPGHATGPVEPLEWSPSRRIQSAFYLLGCTQRRTYPESPALSLAPPPSLRPSPLPFIMRWSQVLPLHNKNLPPLPNSHSRPGKERSSKINPTDDGRPDTAGWKRAKWSTKGATFFHLAPHGSVHY